jgi:hypothetical protein
MPNVESFTVTDGEGEVSITVSADALSAGMPAWELAVSTLDQIPLSTFMVANLDARRRHEADQIAIRSVAWIAVDDAVGVIDGSPGVWEDADRVLVDTRLRLVELAVRCTSDWLGQSTPRLRSVASSVEALRRWVVDDRPDGPHLADARKEMGRLRLQWETWGPVPRHPLVPEEDTRDPHERQPRVRRTPRDWAYTTL